MWENFCFSLNATLPVFGVMALGWLLKRGGFLTAEFCRVGNQLVFRVALPVMLFRQIAGMELSRLLDGRFLLLAMGLSLGAAVVTWGFAAWLLPDKTQVGAFTQGAFRGNTALLGTVLIQNISGSQDYAPLILLAAVPIYNVMSVLILSMSAGGGGGLDGPGLRRAMKNVCKNPILLGIAAGLAAAALGLPIPQMADKSLSLVAQTASPLSLLVIGAAFDWRAAKKKLAPTLAASLVKLALVPAVGLTCAAAMGFRGEAMAALLVMLGTPTAVSSYIMAENMGNDGVLANGIVAVTTLLSSVTLTGWIFLLKALALL